MKKLVYLIWFSIFTLVSFSQVVSYRSNNDTLYVRYKVGSVYKEIKLTTSMFNKIDSLGYVISDSLNNVRLQADTILTGTATIGTGAYYTTVTHGLGSTPSITNILLTPQGWLKMSSLKVTNITSTTFRIVLDSLAYFEDPRPLNVSWAIVNADAQSLTIKEILTGSSAIPYTDPLTDSIRITHNLGSIPSFYSIQLTSNSFGYSTWITNVTSTQMTIKRSNTIGLETITAAITFKWMVVK